MKLLVVGVSLFLSLSTLAQAGGAPPPRMPSPEGQQQQSQPEPTVGLAGVQEIFVMPSGNIGCVYTPEGGTSVYETWDGLAEIQCDRVEPAYVRAVLGGQDDGYIVEDVGDASCCSFGQKFNYDHVVTLGPFQCLSERRGLTCAREDGHGFFLSRALVQAK